MRVNWKKLIAQSDKHRREYQVLPDVLQKPGPGPNVFERKAQGLVQGQVCIGTSLVSISRLRILHRTDREALKLIDAQLHRLHAERKALLNEAWQRARPATLDDVMTNGKTTGATAPSA